MAKTRKTMMGGENKDECLEKRGRASPSFVIQ